MSGYLFLNDQFSKRTSIFGLHLWVVLGICVGAAIVLVLFLISLWFTSRCNSSSSSKAKTFTHNSSAIPNVSKEIQEIRIDDFRNNLSQADPKPINHQSHPNPVADSDFARAQPLLLKQDDHHDSPAGSGGRQRIHIEIGKDHQISYPEKGGDGGSLSSPSPSSSSSPPSSSSSPSPSSSSSSPTLSSDSHSPSDCTQAWRQPDVTPLGLQGWQLPTSLALGLPPSLGLPNAGEQPTGPRALSSRPSPEQSTTVDLLLRS